MIYVDIDIDIDIDIHTDTHTHTNTHCISKILHAHQTTCTRSSCATTWLNLCIASAYLSAATSACVSVYVCARVRTHGLSLALSLSRARARALSLYTCRYVSSDAGAASHACEDIVTVCSLTALLSIQHTDTHRESEREERERDRQTEIER